MLWNGICAPAPHSTQVMSLSGLLWPWGKAYNSSLWGSVYFSITMCHAWSVTFASAAHFPNALHFVPLASILAAWLNIFGYLPLMYNLMCLHCLMSFHLKPPR